MKLLREVEPMVGLSRRSIQEYEEAGLAIKPTRKNKYGYLLYGTKEIERLHELKRYKDLGYRIPDLKKMQEVGEEEAKSIREKKILDLKREQDRIVDTLLIAEKLPDGRDYMDTLMQLRRTDQGNSLDADAVRMLLATTIRFMDELLKPEYFSDSIDVADLITEIFERIASIGEFFEDNVPPSDPQVQKEYVRIYEFLSDYCGGSALLTVDAMLAGIRFLEQLYLEELQEDFQDESPEEVRSEMNEMWKYLFEGGEQFRKSEGVNEIDRMIWTTIMKIGKYKRKGLPPNCQEVQFEIGKLHQVIHSMEILSKRGKEELPRAFFRTGAREMTKTQEKEKMFDLNLFFLKALEEYEKKQSSGLE